MGPAEELYDLFRMQTLTWRVILYTDIDRSACMCAALVGGDSKLPAAVNTLRQPVLCLIMYGARRACVHVPPAGAHTPAQLRPAAGVRPSKYESSSSSLQ